MGVNSHLAVTPSNALSAELMKPVCSATPMPSMATSTTPTGWKCTKLVTMTDILSEIVGDLGDEFDAPEDDDVARHEDGTADVSAALRVSEVNEELDLELPEEEDFETLAGFVLARLGHFPKPGERLVHGAVELEIRAATDRRVTEVRLHLDARAVPA